MLTVSVATSSDFECQKRWYSMSTSGYPVSGRALWPDWVHVRAQEAGGEELRAEGGAQGLGAPLPRQRHHAGN